MSTPKVAILVRVSTKKQETDRQKHELTEEANRRGWEIVEVIEEKISGLAAQDERVGLDRIKFLVEQKAINKVMVHEVSRIARRAGIVHTFVDWLMDNGVSLYWHSQSIETLLPSGKRNAAAGIMLSVLAEMARAEAEQIRERIISGIQEARRKGIPIGRQHGSCETVETFLCRNRETVALIKRNRQASLRDLSRLTRKSVNTVRKIIKAMQDYGNA